MESESGYDIGRLLAFSDAVFAIAITLLVLNIPVPQLPGSDADVARVLPGALLGILPRLAAFALSFYLVGAYWISHHNLCRSLRRCDGTLLRLNLLILFLICLVPFTAAVISRWGGTVLGGELYAGNLTAVGLAYAAMRWYGASRGLLHDPGSARQRVLRGVSYSLMFVVFMVVAPLDLSLAYVAWGVSGLLAGPFRRLPAAIARRLRIRLGGLAPAVPAPAAVGALLTPAPEGVEDDERAPDEALGAAGYDVGRLLSFSDGVFAIALTLLVLDIPVPAIKDAYTNGSLWSGLQAVAPKFIAFGISFLMAGVYWLRHHQQYRHLRGADTRLLWLNLVGLFLVCLTPFTTVLVADYGGIPLALEIYVASLALVGVAFAFARWSGLRSGLLAEPDPPRHAWHALGRSLLFPAGFVPFLVIAPKDQRLAYLSLLLLPPAASIVRRAGQWLRF